MTSMPPDTSPLATGMMGQAAQSSSLLRPQIVQKFLQDRKKVEWAGWVNTEFSKCKYARMPFERQWQINLAFYAGKQYLSPVNVAGSGFRLTTPKAPPWRVRLVINKIRTSVRTECSKLTSSKPIPTVLPATTEDEDFAAARVAESILRAEFNTASFDECIRSWVWWGVTTGNSFIKSYWDPTIIDPDAQDHEPKPNPMGPGFPPMTPPPVGGKIIYERVNPFFIYVPDLLSESLDTQPYVIHVSTKNPLWVEKRFGFKPTPDSRAADSIMESAILSGQNATNQQFDSVTVKEIWLKPYAHPDFPQGGVLTVINDKCVQVQDTWPWPFPEYPFYKYNGMPTGGFYTESVITDLIPIQKEYNRTKSQMIEIKNMMGKPKIIAPRGSVNPRQISSEPGQAILYTPGFNPPSLVPGIEVPGSMGNELDRLASDFDDISGQHEITRGNTPAQVTSGTAISFLQEQDDSKLAYQVAGIEHAVQRLGTHYLKYAVNYWNDTRLVRVVGSDGDFEAKHWRGSDLRGNTDVRIQSGSALPVSKAARQALITEFMTNGWLDPTTGMEILEMGGFEKVMEDVLIDKRQAQRENSRMAEVDPQIMKSLVEAPVGPDGQPVMKVNPTDGTTSALDPVTGEPWQPQPPIPPNSYDDHTAHIHFHNQFRKSQAFDLLDESIKKGFELHVEAHQMALAPTIPQMNSSGTAMPADPNAPPDPNADPNAQPPQSGSAPPPPQAPSQ